MSSLFNSIISNADKAIAEKALADGRPAPKIQGKSKRSKLKEREPKAEISPQDMKIDDAKLNEALSKVIPMLEAGAHDLGFDTEKEAGHMEVCTKIVFEQPSTPWLGVKIRLKVRLQRLKVRPPRPIYRELQSLTS